MPLKSMELTKAEREEGDTLIGSKPDGPKFPFGLQLHLDDVTLKKLGIEELPPVGSEKLIIAKIRCERISEREDAEGKDRAVDAQIIEMGLAPDNESNFKSAAKALYGGDSSKV